MAKFISVLTSDINQSPWVAVQWSDNLSGILSNKHYTAGINLSLPKTGKEIEIQPVTITETFSQNSSTAMVFQLSNSLTNFIRLSENRPTKRFVKSIQKIIDKNENMSF